MSAAIAYLDILGNNYWAVNDRQRYEDNLTHLINSLQRHIDHLSSGDDCVYYFHGCAYVDGKDLARVATYLSLVRSELQVNRLYLQAAIYPGGLGPSPMRKPKRGIPTIQGWRFGHEAALAYSAHYELKAIAIRLPFGAIDPLKFREPRFVISCQVPAHRGGLVEPFLDVKFSSRDLQPDAIARIVVDCLRYRSRSRSTWRYFVPLLTTMVRSVDWASESVKGQGGTDDTTGRQILNWLREGPFEAQLSYLAGAELIYLSLFDEVYRTCATRNPGLLTEVYSVLARRRRLFSALDLIPDEILSQGARDYLIEGKL